MKPGEDWDELRFQSSRGEWAALPGSDIRWAAAALLAEREALAARLDAVRDLHSQTRTFRHPWGETTTCHHCGHERPCPTLAILDNREDPR